MNRYAVSAFQTTYMHVQRELPIFIQIFIQWRNYFIIGNILFGSAIQINIAFDSTQSPHILTFEIRPRTPTINFDSECILTLFHLISNIPFSRGFGILIISQKLPIEPHIIKRSNTLETQDDTTSYPRFRQNECTAIRTDLIILIGNKRRIFLKMKHRIVKLVCLIHIYRDTIILAFPVPRNLYIIPATGIKVGTVKIHRTLIGIPYPIEFPRAVQAHIIRRLFIVLCPHAVYIPLFIRPNISMRSQFIQAYGILALPLRCLYPSESLSQRAQQHTNQKQDIIFHHLILKMDIFQQIFSVII